jgi:hypothetical protein
MPDDPEHVWHIGPLTVNHLHVDNLSDSGGIDISDVQLLGDAPAVDAQAESGTNLDGLRVTFEGEDATRRAAELIELLRSIRMQPIPIRAVGALGNGLDGYYIATTTERDPRLSIPEPTDPQTPDPKNVERIEMRTLVKVGTQKRHSIAIKTGVFEPDPGHTFGNSLETLVGIPAAARRVRVIDEASSPTAWETDPPVAETVATATGDVDRYDLDALSVDDPIFVYELPYEQQGDVDVTARESDQHIFDPHHEFDPDDSTVTLGNGRVRLQLSEPSDPTTSGTLSAERWDTGTDAWSAVDLPAYPDDLDTDWRPLDVDLVRVSQPRLRAQIEFEATEGTNAGDIYALDVTLDRGAADPQWWLPASETDPIPTDLEALLEPIASASVLDTGVSQTLIARKEVRR